MTNLKFKILAVHPAFKMPFEKMTNPVRQKIERELSHNVFSYICYHADVLNQLYNEKFKKHNTIYLYR
jgi:hypothetical protein